MGLLDRYIDVFLKVKDMSKDRYASFDYCYTYFIKHKGAAANKENMTMSCFVLWSYLASWGMLRGSAALLQKNPHYLEPLIKEIDKYDLYGEEYDFKNWEKKKVRTELLNCYNDFAHVLEGVKSCTLLTKIMLGVYGCVPALDTYFKKTFKICSTNLNDKVLQKIYNDVNDMDNMFMNIDVSNFPKAYDYDLNSQSDNIFYTRAKMVDMYGFVRGMVLNYIEKHKCMNYTEDDVLKLFVDGRLRKK